MGKINAALIETMWYFAHFSTPPLMGEVRVRDLFLLNEYFFHSTCDRFKWHDLNLFVK